MNQSNDYSSTPAHDGEVKNNEVGSNDIPPGLKVLVADDNPTNLRVTQLLLKSVVSTVDTAPDGLAAFEKFKENSYDLILMDIIMPQMDGYEATIRIREYESENHLSPIKIIAMTANTSKEDEELCISSGMDDFLCKPFKREEIIKKFSNVFNNI